MKHYNDKINLLIDANKQLILVGGFISIAVSFNDLFDLMNSSFYLIAMATMPISIFLSFFSYLVVLRLRFRQEGLGKDAKHVDFDRDIKFSHNLVAVAASCLFVSTLYIAFAICSEVYSILF